VSDLRAVEPALPGRPNRFEVDLDAIAHNARTLRRFVGPSCTIFAALKADAYGYGIAAVAPVLLRVGVDAISLVSLPDAVALRQRGVEAPILLYPGVPLTDAAAAAIQTHDLMPTILNREVAQRLSAQVQRDVRVFIKVDVGLERLGIEPETAASFVEDVAQMPRLKVHGVYAHMHVRGNMPRGYLDWQFGRFTSVLAALEAAGLHVPIRMTASTAVLEAASTRMNLNAVDPGRVWFGLDRGGPGLDNLDLRPAFVALATSLIQVKRVQREAFHEFAPFPLRPGMRIGIVPIGRIDGMHAFSCGQVLVRGTRVPILATPSIEHTRIDLTDVPDARPGDEVTVIGHQLGDEISPEEVATHQGLPSPGMVALAIRDTIPRMYRDTGTR
jgi:alanine racemase